jgi:hypothetical protein
MSLGSQLKHRAVSFIQRHVINPRVSQRAGEVGQRYALLEMIGRTTGLDRQSVRNIRANPRVRVKSDGTWRSGNRGDP